MRPLSSSAAPASSAATSSTRCSPTDDDRRSRSTTTSPPGESGTTTHHADDPRGSPSCAATSNDLADADATAMAGHDVVIHLASNPDIAGRDDRAGDRLRRGHAADPPRRRGDAARAAPADPVRVGQRRLRRPRRASRPHEDHGPLVPISTYGASKLAGEALICAVRYMFGLRGRAFRFGNVVGRRQTHGVGFDFVRRLRDDPTRLTILGDGSQSKSYIHVADVVARRARPRPRRRRAASRPSTSPPATTSPCTEIAELARRGASASTPRTSTFEYTGGDRGWKGDVPVVRLDTDADPGARLATSMRGSREALRDVDAGDARRRCRRGWSA